MENITVTKADLIATLRDNRDRHQEIFDKAQIAYREKVIEQLDRNLDDAKNGRKIVTFIRLPEPENHVADFETAIQMLEWDTGDTVELTMGDFQRFVQNQWEWGRAFAANTASYLAE